MCLTRWIRLYIIFHNQFGYKFQINFDIKLKLHIYKTISIFAMLKKSTFKNFLNNILLTLFINLLNNLLHLPWPYKISTLQKREKWSLPWQPFLKLYNQHNFINFNNQLNNSIKFLFISKLIVTDRKSFNFYIHYFLLYIFPIFNW